MQNKFLKICTFIKKTKQNGVPISNSLINSATSIHVMKIIKVNTVHTGNMFGFTSNTN